MAAFLACNELVLRVFSAMLISILGIESDQLTIKTSLFDHYKDVERFQIRLFVTDTTTNVTSKAYQNLRRNKPPEGGNCTITPTNVTAGVTNCTIICDGFTDAENDIADYRIFCKWQCLH